MGWRNTTFGVSPVAPASSTRRHPEDPHADERRAWLALYGPQTRSNDVKPHGPCRMWQTFRYVDIDLECLRTGETA